MARKITVEELIAEGIPKAKAVKIVENLSAPRPRRVYWMFKATEEEATEVAAAFPDLPFRKRYLAKES